MANLLKNNKLLNSNSGLSFFMLLPLVSIVLFVLFSIGVSEGNNGEIYDTKFETTKSVDKLSSASLYNNFYVNSLIKNSFEDFKTTFFSDLAVASKYSGLSVDEKVFLGCNYKDDIILYNEAYLAFQSDNEELYSCFPDFEGEFSDKFSDYINKELNSRVNLFFSYGGSDLISVNVEPTRTEILVSVDYKTDKSIDKGEVSISDKVSAVYDLGDLNNLVDTLDYVLPKLSNKIKLEIVTCNKNLPENILDTNLECIGDIFEDMFKERNLDLYLRLDFDFEKVENLDEVNFYSIKINVLDKITKKSLLDFLIVLEDNLPFGKVDYTLSNVVNVNNFVRLEILKPDLKDKTLFGFVILYSYENFLHESNYKEYSTLIDLLEKSNIPSGFVKSEYSDLGDFYGSNKDSGMDMTVFVEKEPTFVNKISTVNIYQIWDEDTQKYELIDDKKIYFAVFAVDTKYNYFTDKDLLNEVFSEIVSIKSIGPKPLLRENIRGNGDLANLDSSIEFELSNYDFTLADSFELYVVKGRDKIFNTVCIIERTNDCQKFTFFHSDVIFEKHLISSFVGDVDISEYGDNVHRVTQFDLEDGSDIKYYVIPVVDNENGKLGVYDDLTLLYKTTFNTNSYYHALSDDQERFPLREFIANIVDNRKPALDSITDLKLEYKDSRLSLTWKKTDLSSDVSKVWVLLRYMETDKSVSSTRTILVDGLGFFNIGRSIDSAEVLRAVPVDSSGKSLFNGQDLINSPVISGVLFSK